MTCINYSDFEPQIQSDSLVCATEEKITGFKNLEKGWCYGEGELFKDKTIKAAKLLNQKMLEQGFLTTNAFPGINGEVVATCYYEDNCFEFTIEPTGEIAFAHERGGEELDYREGLSLDGAESILCTLRNQIYASSGLYTGSTTTPVREGSAAVRLVSQAQTAEYRSLVKSAS